MRIRRFNCCVTMRRRLALGNQIVALRGVDARASSLALAGKPVGRKGGPSGFTSHQSGACGVRPRVGVASSAG